MSVIESIKEGLKSAALAMSLAALVAVTYFVTVELPATMKSVNSTIENVNNTVVNDINPILADAKFIVNDVKPIVNSVGSIVNDAKPIVNSVGSIVNDAKPIVNSVKPIVTKVDAELAVREGFDAAAPNNVGGSLMEQIRILIHKVDVLIQGVNSQGFFALLRKGKGKGNENDGDLLRLPSSP